MSRSKALLTTHSTTTLVIQNLDQVKKDYSREMADVLMNLCGNVICGQVAGDTARQMSDRVGRIMQDRASTTINSSDTSVNYSQQLDMAILPSVISNLSSGEFVGIVADDPGLEIPQKVFHCKVTKDTRKLIWKENFKRSCLLSGIWKMV
ncbi:TraM recognition domain-containing protein [Chitinophaga sp. Hz27]|uniref:TraM recognition domain-containing protein n=1 Tax=Chitinophaga sp. Hz27 TaxID=3347169 RepID=UPI0035E2934E